MWTNYFITSWRSLQRDKFYVFFNLLSLAIAFSLCTIGYFNYQFNSEFNSWFPDSKQLYKINGPRTGQSTLGPTPVPLASILNQQMAGIQATRYHAERHTIKLGDQLFQEKLGFIDPSFLELFHYPNLENENASLEHVKDVILTKETALKLFGTADVYGRVLTFLFPDRSEHTLQVIDILEETPNNVSFTFDLLVHFELLEVLHETNQQDWTQWIDGTFVKAASPEIVQNLPKQLSGSLAIQNEKNPELQVDDYRFDPVSEWPAFESRLYKSAFLGHLHPASVMGTISSAIAILLLGCFNFVNTSITLSGKRLKEIGIRKVIGGSRINVIVQFFLENFLLVLMALLVSGLISYWLVPAYNALFQFELVQFKFLSIWPFALFMSGSGFLVVLLAGGYPALFVSRYQTLEIFRNKVRLGGKNYLTKGLLVFQFMVSVYNIFSLIVFVENGVFQSKLDRGYQIDEVINIPLNRSDQYDALAATLAQNPKVKAIRPSRDLIGFHCENKPVRVFDDEMEAAILKVGPGYLKSVGVRMIKGDYFQSKDPELKQVIVNELMEKKMGQDLLNSQIKVGSVDYRVIGVCQNFNLRPIMLTNKIQPAIVQMSSDNETRYATVRVSAEQISEMSRSLEASWYSVFPQELYRGFYQDKVKEPVNRTNKIIISINSFVAIMSVLISAIGLYSMVSISIQRRTKEFGVRKILGATYRQIAYLINKEIYMILLIAIVSGLAAGKLIIANLLDIIFAYHLKINWTHFLWPSLVLLVIVFASIGYKVYKGTLVNPAEELRME